MEKTIADDPVAAWSRLWKTGALHSCARGIEGNYDGALGAFWRARFDVLHGGNRVVDIGTGNGALPLLAKACATERGVKLEIHGVDSAQIDPASSIAGGAERFSGISFHTGISADSLPFEEASVDLVTSQYAFEYMPRMQTLAELTRVTRAGGRVAFVMHSRDSVISRVANEQLQGCSYLFDQSDFFQLARSLIRLLSNARSAFDRAQLCADPKAEALRLAFNEAAQALMQMIEQLPRAEVLRRSAQCVGEAIRSTSTRPDAASALLEREIVSLQDEHLRLLQLDNATMAPVDLRSLANTLAGVGFRDISLSPVDQTQDMRMGWALVACRE